MNYINLPDNMYKLPSNTLEILNIIEKESNKSTLEMYKLLYILMGIYCFLVVIWMILNWNAERGNSVVLVLATISTFYMIGIIIPYRCSAVEREFNKLQEIYPIEFVIWKPTIYVITTDYKAKYYTDVLPNEKIIDIDMNRLRNENKEIFRQLELRDRGYN